MAENAHTAIDSLLRADNERILAGWKRDERVTDAGTYLVDFIKNMMNPQAYETIENLLSTPFVPKMGEFDISTDIDMQKRFLSQFPRHSTTQQEEAAQDTIPYDMNFFKWK